MTVEEKYGYRRDGAHVMVGETRPLAPNFAASGREPDDYPVGPRTVKDRGPYIRTHSGRKFYLSDPEWYMPDVAHHVARIRRYTGASDFSVGQHMVVGARLAERFYAAHDLLPARFIAHDAPESMYGDMSSPLKRLCPDYRRVLADGERSFERFADVCWVDDPWTKELDTRMWLTERLMVFREAEYAGIDMDEDISWCDLEPFPLTSDEMHELFTPWHPSVVQAAYTQEFKRHLPWVRWESK